MLFVLLHSHNPNLRVSETLNIKGINVEKTLLKLKEKDKLQKYSVGRKAKAEDWEWNDSGKRGKEARVCVFVHAEALLVIDPI